VPIAAANLPSVTRFSVSNSHCSDLSVSRPSSALFCAALESGARCRFGSECYKSRRARDTALGVASASLPSADVRHLGDVPWATIALIGGAVAGILLALLVKPLISLGARRSRRRAATRLHASVTAVAQDQIVDPVRGVLADYNAARDALAEAAK